jgi:aspartyl protease family protein
MTQPAANDDIARIGRWMYFAFWLVVLGLLTLFFSNWYERQQNPNRQLETRTAAGYSEVSLERNRYGHYVASGRINGHDVVFLLDTGASDVSIPQHIADRLGLEHGRRIPYQTANGLAYGYATQLDRVALGGIELRNVRGSINPNTDSDQILLGMSFLRQLEFSQRGETLTLLQVE